MNTEQLIILPFIKVSENEWECKLGNKVIKTNNTEILTNESIEAEDKNGNIRKFDYYLDTSTVIISLSEDEINPNILWLNTGSYYLYVIQQKKISDNIIGKFTKDPYGPIINYWNYGFTRKNNVKLVGSIILTSFIDQYNQSNIKISNIITSLKNRYEDGRLIVYYGGGDIGNGITEISSEKISIKINDHSVEPGDLLRIANIDGIPEIVPLAQPQKEFELESHRYVGSTHYNHYGSITLGNNGIILENRDLKGNFLTEGNGTTLKAYKILSNGTLLTGSPFQLNSNTNIQLNCIYIADDIYLAANQQIDGVTASLVNVDPRTLAINNIGLNRYNTGAFYLNSIYSLINDGFKRETLYDNENYYKAYSLLIENNMYNGPLRLLEISIDKKYTALNQINSNVRNIGNADIMTHSFITNWQLNSKYKKGYIIHGDYSSTTLSEIDIDSTGNVPITDITPVLSQSLLFLDQEEQRLIIIQRDKISFINLNNGSAIDEPIINVPYAFNDGPINYRNIVKYNKNKYLIVGEKDANSYEFGVIPIDIFNDELIISEPLDFGYQKGEDVGVYGNPTVVFDNLTNRIFLNFIDDDGYYHGISNLILKCPGYNYCNPDDYIGVAKNRYGDFYKPGETITIFKNLISGQKYYIQADGSWSTNETQKLFGIAIDDKTMLLK